MGCPGHQPSRNTLQFGTSPALWNTPPQPQAAKARTSDEGIP
jgi:hypothetical protein